MASPMKAPSTATAPIPTPAIAAEDRLDLDVVDCVGKGVSGPLLVVPVRLEAVDFVCAVVLDAALVAAVPCVLRGAAGLEGTVAVAVLGDDAAVEERDGALAVSNIVKSLCWNAIVIGCAHISTGPDTVVKIDVVPSSTDWKASALAAFSAKAVVAPPSPTKTLVQPKYSAVLWPAFTVLKMLV